MQELCKVKSKVRIFFASVALGMGLNAPHIRQIMHYKPPTSLEKYFQETGRAGRGGIVCKVQLYYIITTQTSGKTPWNRTKYYLLPEYLNVLQSIYVRVFW